MTLLGGEVILFLLHYMQQKKNHFYAQLAEGKVSLRDPLARRNCAEILSGN